MKIRVNWENSSTRSWSGHCRRSRSWMNGYALSAFGREWLSRWSENALSFAANKWIYKSNNWSANI